MESLEKPLRFASRTNFHNIQKVKDLEKLVEIDAAARAFVLELNRRAFH